MKGKKNYSRPETVDFSVHAETGILAASPIGVESAEVSVDDYTDATGGDARFDDVNIFE